MKKLAKESKGQSLVEFALILPVLLFLFMGIIQFGYVLNAYMIMTGINRDAARVGSVSNSDEDIRQAIQRDNSVLDANKLSVTIQPNEYYRRRGDSLTVSLKYPVPIIVPLFESISAGSIQLSSSVTMRVE